MRTSEGTTSHSRKLRPPSAMNSACSSMTPTIRTKKIASSFLASAPHFGRSLFAIATLLEMT